MANQNVGTPRFIIDYIQYFRANGLARSNYDINFNYFWNAAYPYNQQNQEIANLVSSTIGLNPIHDIMFDGVSSTNDATGFSHVVRMDKSFPHFNCNIVGLLGHNLKTTGGLVDFSYAANLGTIDDLDLTYPSANLTDDFKVNATKIANKFNVDADGFSFCSCDGATYNYNVWGHISSNIRDVPNLSSTFPSFKPGSLLWGRYYDMPHSPELSLTMSHEYDGVKKQETAGGSTLGYVDYYKPPDWGNLQAWQLDGWDRKYSGRRVWELSFNYLSDSDLEPKHYNMDSTHPDWKLNSDGDKIGNWFTEVIHYTIGGQLPFVFCPDPSIGYIPATQTIPEFAICRFDMETFTREQIANGVYNCSVTIRETW